MRVISAREDELLTKRIYTAELRVDVKDGDGTFQRLNTFQDENWVIGATWGDDTDNQVDQAVISLRRNFYQHSLSPLMEDSEANLKLDDSFSAMLDYNQDIRLYARIRGSDSFDPDGDVDDPAWMIVFDGFIDRVSFATSVITVECRGQGKALQNRTIFSLAAQALDNLDDLLPVVVSTNDKVEDVIQKLLDDLGTGVTLFSDTGTTGDPFKSGESPSFVLSPGYMLTQGQSVMEAIIELVLPFQWTIRYRFNVDRDAFELVLRDPADASQTVTHAFGPQDVLSVDEISTTDADIANVIIVTFKDDTGTFSSLVISASDAASVATFGRRMFIIAPPATDPIRTITEAQSLADNILAQLKDAKVNLTITVPFFPWVEVHDFMNVTANGIHSSTNIIAKVRSHEHTVDAGKSSTQIRFVDGSDLVSFRNLQMILKSFRESDGNAQLVLIVERSTNQSIPDDTTTGIIWPTERLDELALFADNSYEIDTVDDWRIQLEVEITYVNHAPTDPEVILTITEDLAADKVWYETEPDTTVPTGSPDRVKTVFLRQPFHTSVLTSNLQDLFATVKVQVDGGETVNVSKATWTIEKF